VRIYCNRKDFRLKIDAYNVQKEPEVLEKIILDNVRNGADGQRTDTSDRKPVKNTYADITRKGVQRKPLESVRKALLSLSRINPIVRTV
jgi:hypothetical protein